VDQSKSGTGKPAENPTSWYCAQGKHRKCLYYGKFPVVCHCRCHQAKNWSRKWN
jgi:hypothetical protein